MEQLNIHDSELEEIIVEYTNKEVKVNLKSAIVGELPMTHLEFIFQEVTDFHVPINEPWGSGF